MSGLVWSVILVSVLAKVIRFSLPKEGNITKYVSLFFSLCLTAVIALPFADITGSVGEVKNWFAFADESVDKENYEEMFESTLDGALSLSAEEYIRVFLSENYGIASENADVRIEFLIDGDVIAIRKVNIWLTGSAVFANTGEMTRKLEEKLLCEVVISVDID